MKVRLSQALFLVVCLVGSSSLASTPPAGHVSFYITQAEKITKVEAPAGVEFVTDVSGTPQRVLFTVRFPLDEQQLRTAQLLIRLDIYNEAVQLFYLGQPNVLVDYREFEGDKVVFESDEVLGTVKIEEHYYGKLGFALRGSFDLELLSHDPATDTDVYKRLRNGVYTTDPDPKTLLLAASKQPSPQTPGPKTAPKLVPDQVVVVDTPDIVVPVDFDTGGCDGGDYDSYDDEVFDEGGDSEFADFGDDYDDGGCDGGTEGGCDSGSDFDDGGSCDGGDFDSGGGCGSTGADSGCTTAKKCGKRKKCSQFRNRNLRMALKFLPFLFCFGFVFALKRRSRYL